MKLALCIDSAEFWTRLAADMAAARRRVLVQTLSFEGDAVGTALAGALLSTPAAERRLVVDHFTRFMHNDRFLYAPANLLDRELRAEARETRRLLDELRAGGVGVRFTNPVGPLMVRFPARNHKKIIVCDDVAYVGGINFSEHNFEWHDLMLRVDDPAVADWLAADLRATCEGVAPPATAAFTELELASLDGLTNAAPFDDLLARIGGARRSVFVQSPYLTFPFVEHLGAARGRGVDVKVVVPAANNWRVMHDYVGWSLRRVGAALHLYPRMTHVKAILVDDDLLVLGSSNFDILSYCAHAELLAYVTEPALIADFRARVLEPDLAVSPPSTARVGAVRGALSRFQLQAVSRLAAAAAHW